METNDKLMKLLRLMDEPEAMTEEQLQELLSDDEVRKAYDVMADCKKVYQRAIPKSYTLNTTLYKVAAMFVGCLLISGLAFAAIRLVRQPRPVPEEKAAANSSLIVYKTSHPTPVRFDDVCLDSILTVVSAHYGKAVSFCSDEAKGMKFIMTWNPEAPLSDFIDGLNLFDGLSLTLQRDTIYVEITEDKS